MGRESISNKIPRGYKKTEIGVNGMEKLRIPFAIDDMGQLRSPVTAEKGRRYFCPVCGAPVIFRRGQKRVAHFAHKVTDTCNAETITHKTAKLLIQKVIHEWKSGKTNSPILQRKCQICGTSITQSLPDKVGSAILEYKLSDNSIVDIALVDGEVPLAAVEIRVTHAVDETKAKRLPVPFIELDGYEVIKNPSVWKPISDHFKSLICRNCESTYLKFQAKAKQIAKANNIELPKAYYRYGITTCWKCKRVIIVFTWPEKEFYVNSVPKVKPYPRTIQYRYSRSIGEKYWVNTCPYCHSIQGDFFLYMEPEGPFFALHIEEDSPEAFKKDLMKIALYAAEMGMI